MDNGSVTETSTQAGEKVGQSGRKGKDDPTPGGAMQVEKHDFTELVPTDRPRAQSLDGFDEEYTDIVDYIVRCTHRIWDEKNPGLIYTHYADNAVVYISLATTHTPEEEVRATIQRIIFRPPK